MHEALLSHSRTLAPHAFQEPQEFPWAWRTEVPWELKALRPWKHPKDHAAWAGRLPRRASSASLAQRLQGLAWGVACVGGDSAQQTLEQLVKQLPRQIRSAPEEVAAWVQDQLTLPVQTASGHLAWPWTVVLAAELLPFLASHAEPSQWWGWLERIVRLVQQFASPGQEPPWQWQLLGGELAWRVSQLWPELKPIRDLARQAHRVLSHGLVELCDGQGMVHGRHLKEFPLLLACWTRCRKLLTQPWSAKAQDQFDWLVRQMLRVVRGDGSWSWHPPGGRPADRQMVLEALALAADRYDRAMARSVLPPNWTRRLPAAEVKWLPPISYQSDWAQVALLQTHWNRTGPRLWVNYCRPEPQVELLCGGKLLWQGPLRLTLSSPSQQWQSPSSWECVLWSSDEDGDYLELAGDLEPEGRVYRHLFLAREDGFLLLADTVYLPQPQDRVHYRLQIPLAPGVCWSPEPENTEGLLRVGGRALARALPLAAPEWKRECSVPPLQQHAGELWINLVHQGSRFFVPVLFDLRQQRLGQGCTWRRLTVAQQRRVLGPEEAVGFRIQLGRKQWVLFRGVDGVGNRTLLGANLYCEFSLRRFRPDGMTEPLIEVLPEES